MLPWIIYISFLGAALLALFPSRSAGAIRWTALGATIAGLLLAITELATANAASGFQTYVKVPWIPTLGIEYFLGADGISRVMILLTGICSVAGVLFSWNVVHRVREYFALYLVLVGAMHGVFLSLDFFLLFAFYELVIIPKYFLISIWGSTNKEYGAMKLALYSMAGSALVVVGMVAAYVVAGAKSMSLVELAAFPFPADFQSWAFPLVFVGFAVLAGLWPLHTWAPTGHVAAPTAASMLLAGVVMKLGAYGALRVAMNLFPEGLRLWQHELSWLAVIGIVYGAGVALTQRDMKFVIGYSSVSHMGFVLLGFMTLNQAGLTGAVMQMFSHGIIASLLFAVVGRMLYDRIHTRDFEKLEPMRLGRAMPFAAFTFVVASAASMGIPGFSGFVAELMVIIGAWRSFPVLALLTGAGILIGAAYSLRALHKGFFGDSQAGGSSSEATPEPISIPEKIGAAMLMAVTLGIGIAPQWLIAMISEGVHSTLANVLSAGGTQ